MGEITFNGHPREPVTFSFTQRSERDGYLVVIRSYVADDSRWSWWRRAAMRLILALLRSLEEEGR